MTLVAGRLALGAAALFAAVAFAATPADVTAVPKLSARVTDLTSTLTTAQREALEAKLAAFEAQKGSQVAVLLVPTLGNETIEEFAGRVTDEWKLGRKGIDDGALLVIAKQDRKIRIQTGRGTQGTLTDALSKRIVSEIVAPRFRDGDFAGGIDAGVDAIMKAIEGESLPAPSAKPRPKVGSVSSYSDFLFIGFFLVPVVGMFLRGILGRFLGASATSGLTGVAAWFILGSLGVGVIAAVVAFVITLFAGAGGVRSASRGGWGGGYVPGGFGGGGGGGGGGFSGGGGGFDGGGASGSW
ncbi:MAG: TPM domain-containing protein [Usitatibacter sp.]